MSRTYTEAQYSTPSARAMILGWLGSGRADADVDRVARYMSRALRIGGLRACRDLVRDAIIHGDEQADADGRLDAMSY